MAHLVCTWLTVWKRRLAYACKQPRYRPRRHATLNQHLRGLIEHYAEHGRAWYYLHWPRDWQANY